MRFLLTVFFLCFCYIGFTSAAEEQDSSIGDFIKLIFSLILGAAEKLGEIKLISTTEETLVENPELIEGIVKFDYFSIYGLNNLVNDDKYLTFDITDESLLCIWNISITGPVGIRLINYDFDFVLLNYVPIFGNGDLIVQFPAFDSSISAQITFPEGENITVDFQLSPIYHFAKFTLEGFWHNVELSKFLSNLVTALLDVGIIGWDIEYKCINCIISSLLESILNGYLNSFFSTVGERCNTAQACDPNSTNALLNWGLTVNLPEYLKNMPSNEIEPYLRMAELYLNDQLEKI